MVKDAVADRRNTQAESAVCRLVVWDVSCNDTMCHGATMPKGQGQPEDSQPTRPRQKRTGLGRLGLKHKTVGRWRCIASLQGPQQRRDMGMGLEHGHGCMDMGQGG